MKTTVGCAGANVRAPVYAYTSEPLTDKRIALGGLAAAASVRCPVLVITGGRDIMAPARNAQALIAALREPKVVSLSRSGHALTAEEPDAVLDALRAFL